MSKVATKNISSFTPETLSAFTHAFMKLSIEHRCLVFQVIQAAGFANMRSITDDFVSNIKVRRFANCDLQYLVDAISSYRNNNLPLDGYIISTLAHVLCNNPRIIPEQRELFQLLEELALKHIDLFNARELATLARAFSMKHSLNNASYLFDKIAEASIAKIGEFIPQGHVMLAKAFTSRQIQHRELFHNISNAAKLSLTSYNSQNLSSLPLAFRKIDILDQDLFSRIAAIAIRKIHQFTVEELSNLEEALPAAEYPELHQVISARQNGKVFRPLEHAFQVDKIYKNLCDLYGKDEVSKNFYIQEIRCLVDYYIPSKHLMIVKEGAPNLEQIEHYAIQNGMRLIALRI